MELVPNNILLVMENISDGHISILRNGKKGFKYNIKNGIEWLKHECPSDTINLRCLLLKADFRIFHFELETVLNALVQLSSYFFQKNNFEQKCRVFYFHQKSQSIS